MERKRVVILGGSFAGMTAAIELARRLGDRHDITVLSRAKDFLFTPSLIWVPFGHRTREDISFPLAPVMEKKGIAFKNVDVVRIDLRERFVRDDAGEKTPYDYLVIASGAKLDFDNVRGTGPGRFTQSIFSWEHAALARDAFTRFLEDPGPVVVGALPGAENFSAAYELLFNMAHELEKKGLRERAPMTFVTPEPFIGHLGVGGVGRGQKLISAFMERHGIEHVVSARVTEATHDTIFLDGGRRLPFRYAMLAPRFVGIEPVRALTEVVTDLGFVKVNGHYQTTEFPEVYAAGVAVHVEPPGETPVPCGVPKTGYLSEEMGRVVAHNVAATIQGDPLIELPPGSIDAKLVLDAGNSGIIMSSEKLVEPGNDAWLVPGPEAHWAKVAFEKYFLMTHRRGRV
jgi:sulfide:quinone oxidoreductase